MSDSLDDLDDMHSLSAGVQRSPDSCIAIAWAQDLDVAPIEHAPRSRNRLKEIGD